MANYTITLVVDGAREASVKKKLAVAFKDGDEQFISSSVQKVKSAETRAERLAEAEGFADQARQIVEELKDEMDQWKESIPENLQEGDKANEVQEAVDALEELQNSLEQLEWGVSFPGMMG